ncbi:MAG TPA: hypothetical protein VL049_06910 [Candidatus Dormibacteraeota bacterium]|nr:hypothetical protein [Candidatus Dormibacteraeota bacterium]
MSNPPLIQGIHLGVLVRRFGVPSTVNCAQGCGRCAGTPLLRPGALG